MKGSTMVGLTARQSEVLAFIKGYRKLFGYSPAQREIASHFGFSGTVARQYVLVLSHKKAIVSQPRKHRAVRIPRSS